MKKFLASLITMALILSVSACGGNTTEATTTAAANDNSVAETGGADEGNTGIKEETKAEETKAEETKEETKAEETEKVTEAEVTEAETTEVTTEETKATGAAPEGELINNAFLDGLKDKSPLYYEFGKITSTIPCTLVMTVVDSDGKESGTMAMSMESLSRIAVSTDMEGQEARMVMDNGTYYIISDSEKSAIYYSLSGEEKAEMEKQMADSMQFTAGFDFDKTEFTSGTETFMGESLKFETVDDGTTQATIYFDPTTNRVRYMVSEGQTVRIDDYYTGANSSLFDIPADYQMMDLESLAGGLSEAQ